MIMKNYIKMCEQAEEIQKAWKKKEKHIMDNAYVKHTNENILILEEIEFSNDRDEGGEDREYIIFERASAIPLPIPFTKFNKEAFYQYDDGELNVIYLPTQEQLQEMSGIPWWRFDKRCDGVRCCLLEDPLNNIKIRTKEEAGICVVMEKKYNKIWTGEKWVKIE